MNRFPIVYVRGYAGTQSDVEETVDDPFYGFNIGSTHIRQDQTGKAMMFAFQSPFVRLARNFGYTEVFDGPNQRISDDCPDPNRTIWIYRYYDPTSRSFDQPGGARLTIEQAAAGLADFIEFIFHQKGVTATKVYLIAHSMGGLVCRSLIQQYYPSQKVNPATKIDKLFTYGTPHGGIRFDLGFGVLEKLRDLLGVNESDDFGRERMYQYLSPTTRPVKKVPTGDAWDVQAIPTEVFDADRVFCIVGTNAHDYEVAHGLSRSLVGPQSDGLVQMDSAYVRGAHRAYIHRSHSGRYGMVNSEEGYQNLQRFLFGNVKVKSSLCDFVLNFTPPTGLAEATVTYLFEIQIAIRGLVILLHERSLAHFSAVPVNEEQYNNQTMAVDGLPLFTNFLINEPGHPGGSMRYMIRLGLYKQIFERGSLFTADHIEHLPVWSDYLVMELQPTKESTDVLYNGFYSWASESREPTNQLIYSSPSEVQTDAFVELPERGRQNDVLGPRARLYFETFYWE
jgi:pimeloyl-ACP methyl ester carboxylesterase